MFEGGAGKQDMKFMCLENETRTFVIFSSFHPTKRNFVHWSINVIAGRVEFQVAVTSNISFCTAIKKQEKAKPEESLANLCPLNCTFMSWIGPLKAHLYQELVPQKKIFSNIDAWGKLSAIRIIYLPILPHPQSQQLAKWRHQTNGFKPSTLLE